MQYLELGKNRIDSIGLSVFATSSNLSNLFTIILSENKLTSLEPWIYDRGLIGSFERPVTIDLSINKISKFTNNMGNYKLCSNKIPFEVLNLTYNNIKHFMDIINGWQLDIKQVLSCYKIVKNKLNIEILNDDNIPCDCVNYQHYVMLSLKNKPFDFRTMRLSCNFTDPLTKKSVIMRSFYRPIGPQSVCL